MRRRPRHTDQKKRTRRASSKDSNFNWPIQGELPRMRPHIRRAHQWPTVFAHDENIEVAAGRIVPDGVELHQTGGVTLENVKSPCHAHPPSVRHVRIGLYKFAWLPRESPETGTLGTLVRCPC